MIPAYLMLTVLAIGCGGSDGGEDTASDDPPDVAGTYSCSSGCTGTCTFDDELTVIQSGDDIILRSDSFPDSVGTVNNEGEFSTTSDNCECDGQFVSGTAVANCECEGTDCQSVTFTQD